MQLPDLSSKAIKLWLEDLPPNTPCGMTGSAHSCMVAEYIGSHMPEADTVVVSEVTIAIYSPLQARLRLETPRNIRRLITRFDKLKPLFPLPADVLPIFNRSWRPQ